MFQGCCCQPELVAASAQCCTEQQPFKNMTKTLSVVHQGVYLGHAMRLSTVFVMLQVKSCVWQSEVRLLRGPALLLFV
jgi:hypothetical protein